MVPRRCSCTTFLSCSMSLLLFCTLCAVVPPLPRVVPRGSFLALDAAGFFFRVLFHVLVVLPPFPGQLRPVLACSFPAGGSLVARVFSAGPSSLLPRIFLLCRLCGVCPELVFVLGSSLVILACAFWGSAGTMVLVFRAIVSILRPVCLAFLRFCLSVVLHVSLSLPSPLAPLPGFPRWCCCWRHPPAAGCVFPRRWSVGIGRCERCRPPLG